MGVSENFDLSVELFNSSRWSLEQRISIFNDLRNEEIENQRYFYRREVMSATDRVVTVFDRYTGNDVEMLMFGSNNYLGIGNHPHVREAATKAAAQFGPGVSGPPLLNGYNSLTKSLEERLASLKQQESCMIFSSGYNANIGVITGISQKGDVMLYDEYSHASSYDGIQLSSARSRRFAHNDVADLTRLLNAASSSEKIPDRDIFVCVEGVYSMDGDTAPLVDITQAAKSCGAITILDDAHGTGVLGRNGAGTSEHYGVCADVDITVGTFSKAMAVTGGFVCADKDIIEYLRFMSRSYMFSSSLSPMTVAAAHAGLDIMEREPERFQRLQDNIRLARNELAQLPYGFNTAGITPIILIPVPVGMDIRAASSEFHKRGVFVNAVEYPAVPVEEQRFRISLMATHEKEDILKLVEVVDEVYSLYLTSTSDHKSVPA